MNRFGIVAGGVCALALVAALVPAVASGASVASPGTPGISVDERKKPKPTKTPKPPKPKPTKSPTPSPSPSAAVPVQARTVGDWVDRQWTLVPAETVRFTYFVEPVVANSHWEAAAFSGAEAAFRIHKALGYPINRDFRVYMGWNDDWLRQNIPGGACSGVPPLHVAAQCWGTNIIRANFQAYTKWNPEYTPQSSPSAVDRLSLVGILGHELAHMVQEEVSPRYRERMQVADSYWLVEGWATVIEFMMAARVFGMPYVQLRDYKLKAMGNYCLNTPLKDLLYKKSIFSCEYLKGFLAMEYLMSKTGDMSAGLTYIIQDAATPQEAFKQAFSLDLEAFMEEADRYADQEMRLYPLRKWI